MTLHRRRRPFAVAGCLAAVMAAGCGGGEAEPGADAEVVVYASLPTSGALSRDGHDALDGARLALAEAGGEAGGVAVRIEARDGAAAGRPSPVAAAANARAASEDSRTIAYLGELLSGATRSSLPVTNEARMLQVSPGAGAPDLVADVPGGSDPGEFQPTGERTFGRVVPSDTRQAGAAARSAVEAGATSMVVADDGSAYGRELADGFRAAAEEAGVRTLGAPERSEAAKPPLPRRALYFAGEGDGGIAPPIATAQSARAGALVLPDPALEPGYLGGAPAAELSPRLGAPEVLAVAATLDPGHLGSDGAEFADAFRGRYDRPPGRYAAYGYEAMGLILDALERASDPTDRQAVVDAFFDGTQRDGALGPYSITDLGETTLDRMTGYRLEGGRWRPEAELVGP